MFLTGQLVVCVDDLFFDGVAKFYDSLPVLKRTYTVRGMAPGIGADNQTDEIAVYLVELVNPVSFCPPHRERGFRAERFRPLEELTEEQIRSLATTQPAAHPVEQVNVTVVPP